MKNARLIFTGLSLMTVAGLLLASGAESPSNLKWLARDTRDTVANPPFNAVWSPKGDRLFYFQYDAKRGAAGAWAVDPVSGAVRPALPEEEQRLFTQGVVNSQRTLRAYEQDGNLWLEDLKTGGMRALMQTAAAESDPVFLRDGGRLAYEREGNIHILELESGRTIQLTDIRPETAPAPLRAIRSREQTYLESEQRRLFPRFQPPSKPAAAVTTGSSPVRRPAPFMLGGPSRKVDKLVSPDGRHVALTLTDTTERDAERQPIMPRYVTESGFVETRTLDRSRLKSGAAEEKSRIGIFDSDSGEAVWPDIFMGDREFNHYFLAWSPDGTKLLFYVGTLDLKDLLIAVYDTRTKSTAVVRREHDDVYIRDIRGDVSGLQPGWLDDKTIYFLSEEDGWNHLYAYGLRDARLTQLTKGAWEIDWFRLSRNRDRFYFLGTKDGPARRPLYSVAATGGPVVRLTPAEGWNMVSVSPDERRIALLHSEATSPQELYVMDNSPGASPRRITRSLRPDFENRNLPKPEFVVFDDGQGFSIHARLFRPDEGRKNGAALIYAHGTGYAQAVRDDWSDESLLFHYLAGLGYAVLQIDFLGSSGYGRAFRTGIHREIGYRDIDSAVAAKEYCIRTLGVDPKRVGIFGGSYGGFYTLMALFTRPGVFRAGVALYPCTDWAQYTTRFVKRFLGEPFGNEDLYRRCSPIHQAEGLSDHLMIFHGLEDSNVFAQDTIRLVQRLIDLGKTDWDYFLYPTESHGWRQEPAKLDYLRRLTAFFEEHLGGKAEAASGARDPVSH